jgi:hypothetical protein
VWKPILLVFLVCVQEIHALDIVITEKNVDATLGGEYNRAYYFYGDISTIGAVELNNRLTLKSGLSVGIAQDITDIKLFSGARYGLFGKWPQVPLGPLGLGFSWIYNGLPQYNAHSHTLLPAVSWNAKYWGITIGPSFRFSSFFNEPAIVEPTLSISIYGNFINNEKLKIGAVLANFKDFQTHNFGHYLLNINSAVRINSNWSVLNEVEAKQSGGDGLTAAFYGITLRGGARFTW